MPATPPLVQAAPLTEIAPETLYRILALRSAVFVVEQDCIYLDPDGRDLEPGTLQLWICDGTDVVATLRLLEEADGAARIGRVATAATHRGRGLGRLLMLRALELSDGRDVVLGAQTYLDKWYAAFGFVRAGEDYVEDGLPHRPMRRAGPLRSDDAR